MPTTSNCRSRPIKTAQREAWSAGDYRPLGAKMLPASELLCDAAGIRAGLRVLDVATGTGNAALAAARRGCDAVGVDFAPRQLEAARVRAEAEGLDAHSSRGTPSSCRSPMRPSTPCCRCSERCSRPTSTASPVSCSVSVGPAGGSRWRTGRPRSHPSSASSPRTRHRPQGSTRRCSGERGNDWRSSSREAARSYGPSCGRSPSTTLRRPRSQTSTARRSGRSSPCSRDSTTTTPLRSEATSSGSGSCTGWVKASRRRSSTSRWSFRPRRSRPAPGTAPRAERSCRPRCADGPRAAARGRGPRASSRRGSCTCGGRSSPPRS